jgi:hypothetical protein
MTRLEELEEMQLADIFKDRPMPSGRVFVPHDIRLAGDYLTWPWSLSAFEKHGVRREPSPGMLSEFVQLHRKDDQQILAYARSWGVLGLCIHDLPCSHNQYPNGIENRVRPCLPELVKPLPKTGSEFRLQESLQLWRFWSLKAQSLLNIGACANQGKIARLEDWQVVKDIWDSGLGETAWEPFMESAENARAELARELDRWISIGQVRPQIGWRNKRGPKAQFSLEAVTSGPNLFGLLALNIAVAIAAGDGEKGLAICSACAQSYIPKRRPDPNRRNYCANCGLRAAQRDASRRYRQTSTYRQKRMPQSSS